MNYNFTDKCKKDIKKLIKKYPTLEEDIKEFCNVLPGVDLKHNKKFAILHSIDCLLIIKARLFCRSLRKDTLRIILSFDKGTGAITHIEIYFKGTKELEDKTRIDNYLSSI